MGLFPRTYKDQIGFPGDGIVLGVDPGNGSDNNDGDRMGAPLATLQAAIDLCVAGRGDLILRFPGGEEVTETVTFDKTGITVRAVDYGCNPQAMGELFSTYAAASFTDGPVATITARCKIEGLGFASRDTGATFYDGAAMLIGGLGTALPFGVHILRCRFPKWNLDNRIGIAVEGSSDVVIEECSFEGVGSDFDSGIYIQGGMQNITIINNRFRDCTYAIQAGAFAGGGPHAIIKGNICEDSKLFSAGPGAVATAGTGFLCDNWCEGATDTGSYNDSVNDLQAAGWTISGQHYAE